MENKEKKDSLVINGSELVSEAINRLRKQKGDAVIQQIVEFQKHIDSLEVNKSKIEREINFYNKILERIDKNDFEIMNDGKIHVKGMWNGYAIGI